MKGISKLTVSTAAVMVVAASVSTSAFADWRNRDETFRHDRGGYENRDRDYRDNERVTVEGRISNMTRERDGYRMQLDRSNHSFWVAERSARGNNLRIGLPVSLGGIFRRGLVYVDVIGYPDTRRDANRVFVRGYVSDVDYRRGVLYVRDDASRRVITVNASRLERESRRFDLDDLRRGDYVDVYGDWGSRGTLEAYRVEQRGGRRY